MKAMKFKKSNVVFGADQPEYLALPAYKNTKGVVVTCYKLSLIELVKVLFTRKVWFTTLTFNQPLQPQLVTAHNPIGKEVD